MAQARAPVYRDDSALGQDTHKGAARVYRSRVEFEGPREPDTNMGRELMRAFERHADRVLLVDTASGRQWTGAKLHQHCARLATGLVSSVGLKPNDIVMTICDHHDLEIVAALGIVVAGGALFGTSPLDGYSEVEMLCNIVRPDVFVVSGRYHERALLLRQNVAGLAEAKIVWLDRPSAWRSSTAFTNGHSTNGHPQPPANGPVSGAGGATNSHGHDNDEQLWPLTDDELSESAVIKRDRVYLVEELQEEVADLRLVESIVANQIDAQRHTLTYMLTSGSTGRPKVVPSTHAELIHGLYSMISACTKPMSLPPPDHKTASLFLTDANNNNNDHDYDYDDHDGHDYDNDHKHHANVEPDREPRVLMPIGPDDIVSGDLPLDHGAGLNTMFLALWLGAKFVVMPSYDVDAFWQAVSDHRITASISSTTFCYRLFARLKQLVERNEAHRWCLDSFKFISCCGAKMAFVELVREVQLHYPHIEVTQAYGCTEIGFIAMVHRDYCRTHLHSVGHLFPGIEAKVVEFGLFERPLAADEPGELLVWAASKFKGYRCHNTDNAAQIYANCHDERLRFYRTGDQAHFDAHQRLYIHGRFKDTLCLMEDWKILPAELEDVVDQHPLVEMSAVVGMPDPQLPGCHAPKAFVKLIDVDSAELRQLALVDSELSARRLANDLDFIERHIYDFVAQRTARPKHLTGGVRFVAEFPRVGLLNKVDRNALKRLD